MKKDDASGKLTDALGDIADIASEAIGLMPVVGPILKLARLGGSIPDRLFLRKSEKFFGELDKATKKEVESFFRILEHEEKLAEFGHNVLFLIDRMDDLEKPVIVGRIFRAAIEKKLHLETAKRIAALVSGVYSEDIKALPDFTHGSKGSDPDVASSLASAGFLRNIAEDWGDELEGGSITYSLNRYGSDLVKFGLNP